MCLRYCTERKTLRTKPHQNTASVEVRLINTIMGSHSNLSGVHPRELNIHAVTWVQEQLPHLELLMELPEQVLAQPAQRLVPP
jgi:hypothetical protein